MTSWDALGSEDLALSQLVLPGGCDSSIAVLAPFLMQIAAATLQWQAPLMLLFSLHLLVGARAEEVDPDLQENCSAALGFNSSSGPKDRSKQDLQFCTEHHKRTCCERNHTRQVLSWYGLFSTERSEKCMRLSRLVGCGLCDGDVGVGMKSESNLVLLCPSLCERWFQACSDDFFASSGSGATLQPCGSSSLVCSPLHEITEDPRSFCESAGGFSVAEEEELDECFDGVPAARSRGRGPKAPYSPPGQDSGTWWRRFQKEAVRWMQDTARSASLEAYLPACVVGAVGIFFAWYLMREA
mmetsp:Transcript_52124/g.124155  ORF Transcript_52124/g.124155 Transcript_52124/m.124155 type:complete len:298 (+) Transcript_52124:89-982(+)